MRANRIFSVAALAAGLLGCVQMPTGPTVAVMPAPGKPMDLFMQEDDACRGFARMRIGGAPNPNDQVAAGMAGGAVVGGVLSGGRPGGVTTGVVVGGVVGSGAADQSGMSLQRRYNIAYMQCMYSKGNQLPMYGYSSYSAPPGYGSQGYAYPPPPGTPAPSAATVGNVPRGAAIPPPGTPPPSGYPPYVNMPTKAPPASTATPPFDHWRQRAE